MKDVVFWKDVVGKEFLDRFIEIATAEYYTAIKDIPFATLYKKYNETEMENYHRKRALMRSHGWFQSYLSRSDELKFMSIYPIKERHYVSVSQYLAGKQADRIAADEEEYYRGQEALKKMIPYAHVEDEEFVPEMEETA